MRRVLKLYKARRQMLPWYDYYQQLHYRYSTIFFGSLISKGLKLRAFNNYVKIKQGLKVQEKNEPHIIFLVSMMKISPDIIALPVRLGGAAHGVPMPISEHQRLIFSVKWVLKLLKDKYRRLDVNQVVDVMVSSLYNKGLAIEKKQSVYKQGSLNRHLLKFFK